MYDIVSHEAIQIGLCISMMECAWGAWGITVTHFLPLIVWGCMAVSTLYVCSVWVVSGRESALGAAWFLYEVLIVHAIARPLMAILQGILDALMGGRTLAT